MPELAAEVYYLVVRSGDRRYAPLASRRLAHHYWALRSPGGARHWFEKTMETGPVPIRELAAESLGWLLVEQGDRHGATAAFRTAVGKEASPGALCRLALLFAAIGDPGSAEEAFRSARAGADAQSALKAAVSLGLLAAGREGHQEAAEYFREVALSAGRPTPTASYNLALLAPDVWAKSPGV